MSKANYSRILRQKTILPDNIPGPKGGGSKPASTTNPNHNNLYINNLQIILLPNFRADFCTGSDNVSEPCEYNFLLTSSAQ
jgi:hypothetical protein